MKDIVSRLKQELISQGLGGYFTLLDKEIKRRNLLVDTWMADYAQKTGINFRYIMAPLVPLRTDLGSVDCTATVYVDSAQVDPAYFVRTQGDKIDVLNIKYINPEKLGKSAGEWFSRRWGSVITCHIPIEKVPFEKERADYLAPRKTISYELGDMLIQRNLQLFFEIKDELEKLFGVIRANLAPEGSLYSRIHHHGFNSDIDIDVEVEDSEESMIHGYCHDYLRHRIAEDFGVYTDFMVIKKSSPLSVEPKLFSGFTYNGKTFRELRLRWFIMGSYVLDRLLNKNLSKDIDVLCVKGTEESVRREVKKQYPNRVIDVIGIPKDSYDEGAFIRTSLQGYLITPKKEVMVPDGYDTPTGAVITDEATCSTEDIIRLIRDAIRFDLNIKERTQGVIRYKLTELYSAGMMKIFFFDHKEEVSEYLDEIVNDCAQGELRRHTSAAIARLCPPYRRHPAPKNL